MKVSLSWLRAHLDTDWSALALGEKMTEIGLELEALVDRSTALAPFVIARVVAAVPHPDARQLRLCRVDTGTQVVQVVCGAPNAETGLVGVFAPVGSDIPGTGVHVKVARIRDQESHGMLCSERELPDIG